MSAEKKTPAQRAAACFAIERSSAHEGERAAARRRGLAICARHGLDPAKLDQEQSYSTVPRGFTCWEAALAAAAAAQRDRKLWEIGRKQLLEETRRAAERDLAADRRQTAAVVAEALARMGLHLLRDGPDRWWMPGKEGLVELDAGGVMDLGRERFAAAA